MRRPAAFVGLVLVVLPLAGCATSALTLAPDHPDAPWTPATTPNGEIIAGERAPPDEPPRRDYVLPSNSNLAGVPPPETALERRRPYLLPELIDIAESSNPVTRNAWNDARNAALVAGIAESTFLPIVSAGIIEGYQNIHSMSSAPGSITSDIELNGNVSVLSVEWLLFDFGERAALSEVAKQGSVISNIAFTAAHQQVIYNVSLAFYAYAAARERLASTAESLRDAEKVQDAAESRYKSGIGTVVDVAQTRQASAQAKLERVQAEGAAQNAYLALISAMGISPMTRLAIADVSRRKLSPTMVAPIKRIASEALARRSDILTGYAARKASLASLRAAQAEFFPKVFFSANGTRLQGDLDITAVPGIGEQLPIVNLPGNVLQGQQTQLAATALIGATVPLYDGGLRAARLEQARDNLDKADTSLVQIRNEAVRQIIMARNTLTTSISAYSASTALVSAAQTSFDATLAAYRSGIGSISDATTAERQLLAARNAKTDSYSAALSAAATLALATGILGSAPH
jgi:outer membrane protein